MSKLLHINKMSSLYRHATLLTNINHNLFICILVSLLLPTASGGDRGGRGLPNVDEGGRRLTREYHLRQGALRGLIVKPSRQYDLQSVEMFLGIPYAAPPVGSLRFMPPVSAPLWPGVKMATKFAPVCPQTLPPIKKGNPPSLGRQNYRTKLEEFLKSEAEDCLYLNIYVPYREQKTKKFPILVFIHGDSFEWSSGNSYDGRILSSYGNIMVITVNYRLGILGFLKPSLTEHDYGNNGLLDQLAALQWIKDNVEDLNGDPRAVTIMGHGTGAACVNFMMLSPISNGLFHRAILMSGSALSDWAMTRDPTQYTLQVAQSLGCNPNSKNMMACLQNKPLSEIKRIQILSRDFETPLGPTVAGPFIPNEPSKTMESYPHLLSRYQLLSGVTESERYHDFGVIELDHGVLENQRDDFITKYAKVVFNGAEDVALKEILKQYATSKQDPQRWSVEANRDVILDTFSDSRTTAPMIDFANYQSRANRQSYFYMFAHNSVSTDYAGLNKSVHGEELPYVFGVPLGGANTHFHSEYTQREKLLSEVMMRLWTNFVKIGTPNTQSSNEYYTLDRKTWNHYNIDWPEYNVEHQSYLILDIPPRVSSYYRANFTKFWLETLPSKMRRFVVDPLFEYTPIPTTQRPKPTVRNTDPVRKPYNPAPIETSHYVPPTYGRVRPYIPPDPPRRSDPDMVYREIQAIKTPARPVPHGLLEKPTVTTDKVKTIMTTETTQPVVKTSGATITLIVSLGILFLLANITICTVLYFKKRKLQVRELQLESTRHSRAELGDVDVIGQKSQKEDKSALQTLKNGCSVIKSMSFSKMRNSSSKSKKTKLEPCKTPKSDDSGGFRERFQLRRHLSTSTLDAHTKVREWINNEVMHRCAPNVLTKSSSDMSSDKNPNSPKPFTRSEELLSETKKDTPVVVKVAENFDKKSTLQSKKSSKTRTSEKTTSTSALGSHSSIGSHKQSSSNIKHKQKSSDSLKSKGSESNKSRKVSVAIDATPAARTISILKQEPIEVSKSFDLPQITATHSNTEKLQRSKTESDVLKEAKRADSSNTFTTIVSMNVEKDKPLRISHKHSTSDPVTDVNYDKIIKEKIDSGMQVNLLPPLSFRNDVNVTSKDESIQVEPLSAAEALLTIQRRNFPKVLPDLPKAQKRLSLQPNSLHTFRSFVGGIDPSELKSKIPPQPPPRTTTLERRLAYKNTKSGTSTFDPSNVVKIPEQQNYENIDSLSPPVFTQPNRSFESFHSDRTDKSSESTLISKDSIDGSRERYYPRVIIASAGITSPESKIIIQPSRSQMEIPSNAPRVRLPDDFHSQTTGSVTSFSSFASDDDDDDELIDYFADDKLLQELVGGVESPTNMEDILDTKGPDTFSKKLEIVPVKLNPGTIIRKNTEDYVCISDLLLPDVSAFERTANIKSNFGQKLQNRSESINRPPEKAVKLKQRKSLKPTILNRSLKKEKKPDKNKNRSIEHSNSGSSNDTETSTGTVKRVELKRDE